MTNLALLLLVNHLTGSTAALATMAIVLALPSLLFGLFAGVLIDRADRKRVMMVADIFRAIFVLGFILVDSADKIWILYAIGFIQASIATFFAPARGALIPNIVPKEGLLTANSISETSRIIFGLLGTGLGGFLIGQFDGYSLVFGIDAATFLLSVLFVMRIHYTHKAGADKAPINAKRMVGELRAGLKVTFSNRILAGTIVSFAVTMLGLGAVNILLVPLLVDDLMVKETWFVAIEFSQTAGMILAGALVAALAARLKPTYILVGALVGLGVTVAFMSLPTAVWHIIVILFFAGLCVTPLQAAGSTIIQTAVPDEVRGRTGSANNTLITTSQLVSMGLAGVLADVMGARNVFILGGGLVALAGFVALFIFRGAEINVPTPAPALEMQPAD
jgi:MFS transporter, DHA3 family, macrolide efflux protein